MNQTRDKKCLIDSSVRQPRLSSGLIQRTLLLIPGWIAPPAKQVTISECAPAQSAVSGHSCCCCSVFVYSRERRVWCCQQHYHEQLAAGRGVSLSPDAGHKHEVSINNLSQFLDAWFVTQVAKYGNNVLQEEEW